MAVLWVEILTAWGVRVPKVVGRVWASTANGSTKKAEQARDWQAMAGELEVFSTEE